MDLTILAHEYAHLLCQDGQLRAEANPLDDPPAAALAEEHAADRFAVDVVLNDEAVPLYPRVTGGLLFMRFVALLEHHGLWPPPSMHPGSQERFATMLSRVGEVLRRQDLKDEPAGLLGFIDIAGKLMDAAFALAMGQSPAAPEGGAA